MFTKNQQFYDLIINRSSDAIAVISEGKYIFVNNKALEIFGTNNSSELIGNEFFDFINNENKEMVTQYVDQIYSESTTFISYECKIKGLNEKEVPVEIISSYILYNGNPSYISLIKNISSQKQINELENHVKENEKVISDTIEFNRQMMEFFANISHELKTPLNVILGAIQLLELPNNKGLSKSFDLTLNKYIGTMKQNCYRLLRIINNLIDVSKFDTGYFKLNLSNYNIVSVIEDITLSVADYIETSGVKLIFDTDTEEKIIAIDADKVERIILNLLSNAVKFTDAGDSILVRIEDKNESIIISVKDTGVGIPKDKLDIIFERFGQVDKTLSRNNEGSGIGLCLVKSLVGMHDGTIKVKSKIGEGSEFIIELPIRIVEETEVVESCLDQSNVEKINIEFSDIYS
ncbi:PAS domain-containing sensor histidine kinase [Clostridium magnum]|uniref:histidine kinase n=1 Tax=Clostridium magnum DSM 2767 TaxID=1121326 RepID=A0A162R0S5_9CLOT|nr:PAS domain-containing sensor histidine kinase [Clostridium magnum]KZL89249.1 Non-motile and phage-resistance protein [Clostridium magnum DSM 2767]SHI97644.1 PAS domain S-box-containing protein [Clostridium magnum DSM 2767]